MRSELPDEWTWSNSDAIQAPDGLVGGPFGSSLGRKDYVQAGIPVIRGANLGGDGRFESTDFVFVTEEKVHKDLRRNTAVPGDLVFTQRGTLGQVGVVPAAPYSKYVISQSQMRLRVDPIKANRDFVYYAFRSPRMVDQIKQRAIATGVPHINLGILASLPLPLPPRAEQERIASILCTLDDKIDSNRRLVLCLDETAAGLFRARFVDFVGVGDLDDGEFGPVPRSWAAQPVAALARFVNGKAFTKFGNERGRMVIRIADLKSGPGPSTVYTDHDADVDLIAQPGDLLFAWSGSLGVYRWYRKEALINQHIFKVIPEGVPDWFVYQSLKHVMPHFQAIAADKATTMGHIKRSHLSEFGVAVPPADELSRWDEMFAPLYERALGAMLESETLSQTRDTLLPKLISGELRLPDSTDPAETIEPLAEEHAA